MIVKMLPFKASGTVWAPPSKSYAHRLMICAALADGTSRISRFVESGDVNATLGVLEALGVTHEVEENCVSINGTGGTLFSKDVMDCAESASTLRLLLPIALVKCDRIVINCSERLLERGIDGYKEIFEANGITALRAYGAMSFSGSIKSGSYKLKGDISSQFISGMLMALSVADGDSTLEIIPPFESKPYVDMTLYAMSLFGVTVNRKSETLFEISGNSKYQKKFLSNEGDWSNGAFLYALNFLGGKVKIEGLKRNTMQGDKIIVPLLYALRSHAPEIDISNFPDLAPILMALGASKNGCKLINTRRLKIKECDRGQAMAEELKKFNIDVLTEENSITVKKGRLRTPLSILSSHNDHRIIMALSLLTSIVGGTIDGADAINKSWCTFYDMLEKLGAKLYKY